MKFLVDESSDARLAAHLQRLGHDAATIAKDFSASLKDSEVLAIASQEHRILITNDRDFGELVFRFGHSHAGVIYFRHNTTSLVAKTGRLDYVLENHSDSLGQFLVVTERSVRIRQTT